MKPGPVDATTMRLRSRWAALIISLVTLGGCTISTSFEGPGYDGNGGVEAAGRDSVLVVVTEAELGSNWLGRPGFWRNVSRVEDTLADRPGFIGHAKRTELFGSRAWTMTVWTDEAAMRSFVSSDVHQRAIAESYPALRGARFARLTVAPDEVPISWDRALEALGTQGRSYAVTGG